jgi:RNA polymerase sigma factor (sigma-70 family)
MLDSKSYNSEQECWKAFLSGRHTAFALLFKSNYNALYQYALRYTRRENLAHECVQQLFYQLWVSRSNISEVSNVKAYLFKSLRSNLQREGKYQQRLLMLESAEQPLSFSPEEILLEDEADEYRKKVVADVLNVLPQRQREAVYLKYYENLSYQEIADVLNINYQSVVNLVFRAIQRLREEDQLKKLTITSLSLPLLYLLYFCLA